MAPILGHEKWFTEVRFPPDPSFLLHPATLAFVLVAVVVAMLWRGAATRFPTPQLPFLRPLGRLSPWVPRLLAIHAGVSLLAQAARGTYLAPNLALPEGPFGTALAILEGLIGVWLITGVGVRLPAALLVLAGPLGMLHYGPVALLERADLLGIALFLVVLPSGRDDAGRVDPERSRLGWAVWSLRLLVGLSLIIVALTEKLLDPKLALVFLDRYPAFNLLQAAGLPVSHLTFVRLAGSVEVLFGLLIVSGAMPQLAVILAGIPFNVTMFFFGPTELIGHLPVYGAMLALLVYGSDAALAPLVSDMRPWRRWVPARDAAFPPVLELHHEQTAEPRSWRRLRHPERLP